MIHTDPGRSRSAHLCHRGISGGRWARGSQATVVTSLGTWPDPGTIRRTGSSQRGGGGRRRCRWSRRGLRRKRTRRELQLRRAAADGADMAKEHDRAGSNAGSTWRPVSPDRLQGRGPRRGTGSLHPHALRASTQSHPARPGSTARARSCRAAFSRGSDSGHRSCREPVRRQDRLRRRGSVAVEGLAKATDPMGQVCRSRASQDEPSVPPPMRRPE